MPILLGTRGQGMGRTGRDCRENWGDLAWALAAKWTGRQPCEISTRALTHPAAEPASPG